MHLFLMAAGVAVMSMGLYAESTVALAAGYAMAVAGIAGTFLVMGRNVNQCYVKGEKS